LRVRETFFPLSATGVSVLPDNDVRYKEEP